MITLQEQFKYHPPTTKERLEAHAAVNEAALAFAETVCTHVHKEQNQQAIISQIQVARMLANQYITLEELVNNEH